MGRNGKKRFRDQTRGCQIFLGTIYQIGGKIHQMTTKYFNVYPLTTKYTYALALKCTKTCRSKDFQNIQNLGFFGRNTKSGNPEF
jgi:hypothetical protein